ncbi:MAG: hypothetical protein ACFFFB_20575 [Candidatus Heimdallarchaeota archaeon]
MKFDKNNLVSDLVSELFNNINSKATFEFISDLLISSLSIYKKKYSLDIETSNQRKKLEVNEVSSSTNLNTKTEYLSISNDIHSILINCPDLSTDQKLDYCNSQRYFMKMYMKEIVINLKLK